MPLLLGSLLVAYFPHFFWMPVWVSILFLVLLGLRGLLSWRNWPLPWKWLRTVLVLCIAVIIVFSFGLTIGRDAGTALFALMLGFKTYEISTYRDGMVTLFLAYFLVLTTVLFSETMLVALSILAAVLILTSVLILMNSKGFKDNETALQSKAKSSFRLSLVIFLQALPLTLLCFLLFPRLPGAFFGLSSDVSSSVSGLNDSMSPGSISKLTLSREVAFRSSFEQKPPPASKLYWRALVLWNYKHKKWQAGELKKEKARVPLPAAGKKNHKYTITLEAHSKHYLPALDIPVRRPKDTSYLQGHILYTKEPLKKRKRYDLLSVTRIKEQDLNPGVRKIALSLPEKGNPKARKLAGRLRQASSDPQDMIDNVLDYFRENEFYYTLEPPLLGRNPVDEFLFQTRKGYCEHYASAFVWLMRAAGIPARVVVGYQGGEYNPLGNYYIVRQSDAHAWAEVWMGKRAEADTGTWQRFDPTSAVAPDRVQQGISAITPKARLPAFLAGQENNWFISVWNETRMAWDALNNGWNQWVLNYTHSQQKRLLSHLGLGENWIEAITKALLIGLAIIILFLLLLLFWLLRNRTSHLDSTSKQYRRFCHKIARYGLQKQSYEGPKDFAARVVAKRPDLKEEVEEITDLYVGLRYASTSKSSSKELRKSVRRFRPKRKPA